MDFLVGAFVFGLGLIIGSFLNVVVYRYNTGLSIVHGRSRCLSCGRTLGFFDLIPVVSFIVQRGRCGTCRARISFQYPVVELVSGLFLLFVYLYFGLNLQAVLVALAGLIALAIAVYDMKHKIIPDGLVYTFIALCFISFLVRTGMGDIFHGALFGGTLAGPITALPFALLWFVSRGRWMGFGDAKLALGIGWLLGLPYSLTGVMFAFWIGTVVSLGLIGIEKLRLNSKPQGHTIKSEIPFAPFLITGMYVELFLHFDLFHLTTLW